MRAFFRVAPLAVIVSLLTAFLSTGGAATAASERVEGSYVVQLRRGVSPSAGASIARQYGGKATFTYDAALRGFAFSGPGGAVARLKRDRRVEALDADYVVHLADDRDAAASHNAVTDSDAAKTAGYVGSGPVQHSLIAVLDTGISRRHPVFAAHSNVIGGTGRCVGTPGYPDGNGHGTATASNAAGRDGVSHEAHIFAVKVFPGASMTTSWSRVICGLNFVRKYNVNHPSDTIDVVNMSIAGQGSAALKRAVENVISSGVVVVAAAGNNGGALQAPARYAGVISASALNHAGTRFASFSARHATMAAPGVNIFGADKGSSFSRRTGTSRSAPQIAGAVAILLALGASPSTVAQTLRESGRCPGGAQRGAAACPSPWPGGGGSKEPLLDTYCAAASVDALNTDPVKCPLTP